MESMEENCRSLTQEHAVQTGLEMFGLLAARCVVLFEEHLQSQELGVKCHLSFTQSRCERFCSQSVVNSATVQICTRIVGWNIKKRSCMYLRVFHFR